MPLARKIAYNAFVSAFSKVLSTGLALFGISIITRHLGVEGFGDYAIILNFFAFFFAVGDLGLYTIATREISRPQADANKIMGAIFLLRLATVTIILAGVPALVWFLPYDTDIKWGIVLSALVFAFAASYNVLNGIFQKHLAMDRVAVTELFGKIIQVAGIVLVAKIGGGLIGIILALLGAMLFNFIVLFFLARRYIAFVPHIDIAYWKKFLRLSLPMGIATFVTFLYIKTDIFLLSLLQSQEAVGIYGAAYKIVDNLAFFPAMITGLTLPLLSRYIFTHKERFALIANKTLKVFLLLAVPLIVAVFFMADFIMAVIGGEEFVQSVTVLRILIFASALIFFGHFFNSILIAGNHQVKLMRALIGVAVFNITANSILIPRFSYIAAASVSVVTELLVVGLGAFLVYKYLRFVPQKIFFFRILLAGGVMTMIFYVLADAHILIAAAAATCAYIVFVWLLRIISQKEVFSIISRKETQ